ncbi:hypothetical protein CVT24_003805 [Panaeolus cyanescens]|uniref:DUF6533 domain-containing protein n=1 Tax=Panaeolus cyanescens TaxID=181874 RepID=A0A409VUV9_9AGAR|nr:hypothetical protein CVT24_003805 [Panaeolus cyanescens]
MDAQAIQAAQRQLQSLIDGLFRVQLVTSFDLIAISIYMFDWLATFEMEVELVWKSNWNFMKVLFLLQRYLPFVDSTGLILYIKFGSNLNTVTCKRLYTASGYMMATGTALAELILTLRVWAVWHRDRKLMVLLPMLYVGCWAPIMYFMYRFLTSLQFVTLPGSLHYVLGTDCFIVEADRIFAMVWVMLMVLQACILILMLIPGYHAYRAGGDSALYNTIYRDGSIYYLYLFALSTINIIVIRVLPHGYENLFTGIERCVHSMLSSRVLLHIRSHARRQEFGAPHWADGVTDLPFSEDSDPSSSSARFDTVSGQSYRSIVIQRTQVTSEKVI